MKLNKDLIIVLGTTALIMWHSYSAWLWITNNEAIAIITALVFDTMAVYLWLEGANKLATLASIVVALSAILHLSSNVIVKLDKIETVNTSRKANDDLLTIGKGTAKWGNHEGVVLALEKMQVSEGVAEETGTYTWAKLIASTVLQFLMVGTAIAGQVYASKKLSIATAKLNKGANGTETKEKVTVIRNTVIDSEVKEFAIQLWNDINTYMKEKGITSGNNMMSLLGENQGVATRLKQTKETGKGITLNKLQELQGKLKAL